MDKYVFVHIPKTAGTSLRAALRRTLGDARVSPAFSASRLTAAEAEALEEYDVITGHISIDDVERYFPRRKILTVLRNPIDRCISWYYFARGARGPSPHHDVTAALTRDIDEFFSSDTSVIFRNIYNRQVRQLGGHVMDPAPDLPTALLRAKETLEAALWVGRQETIDSDISRLVRVFPGLAGTSLARLNATRDCKTAAELSHRLLATVASCNVFDMQLYSHLCDEARTGGPSIRREEGENAPQP